MKKLYCLPILLLLGHFLSAQVTTETTWKPADPPVDNKGKDFLFGLQVGVPSAEMRPATKNQMGDVGFGVGFLFLSDPYTWGKNKRSSALRLGGGLGYTYYGRFKTEVPWNSYTGRVKTYYGIFDVKAIARFRPQLNRGFHPFADLQAGVDIYTSTTREDLSILEREDGDEDIDNTTSSCFTKGIGGGIAIGSRNPEQAKFVIRAMYNWGGQVKYVVRNSMYYEPADGTLHYEQAKAPLRYVSIQVGIGL